MFLSFTVTEGVQDWIESSHRRYITTGILQPRMHSYMLSVEESFSYNKIELNLTTINQGVLSIRERYIRDTRLVSIHQKMLYPWQITYFHMLRLEDRTLDASPQIDTALQVMLDKDVDDKIDERQSAQQTILSSLLPVVFVMNYVTMLVISDLSIFVYLSYHISC